MGESLFITQIAMNVLRTQGEIGITGMSIKMIGIGMSPSTCNNAELS